MVRGRLIVFATVLGWGALALAACGKSKSPSASPPVDTLKWRGLYRSDTLPALEGVRRLASLVIGADTQARLAIEFIGRGRVFRRGAWRASGDILTFEPRRADGLPLETPFVWRLEGRRLAPVRWDRELYGDGGIPLTRDSLAASRSAADTTGAKR